MPNIYVNTIGTPRKPRNKKIYGGNSFISNNVTNSGVGGILHIESGKIFNIENHDLTVTYKESFDKVPVGVGQIALYRYVDGATVGLPAGSFVKQDALFYFPDFTSMVNPESFRIIIDPNESLLDLILEYIITD